MPGCALAWRANSAGGGKRARFFEERFDGVVLVLMHYGLTRLSRSCLPKYIARDQLERARACGA